MVSGRGRVTVTRGECDGVEACLPLRGVLGGVQLEQCDRQDVDSIGGRRISQPQ